MKRKKKKEEINFSHISTSQDIIQLIQQHSRDMSASSKSNEANTHMYIDAPIKLIKQTHMYTHTLALTHADTHTLKDAHTHTHTHTQNHTHTYTHK